MKLHPVFRSRRTFGSFAHTCLLFFLLIFCASLIFAQDESVSTPVVDSNPLKPPTDISVKDTPNDAGGSITIRWTEPTPPEGIAIKLYRVLRAEAINGEPGQYEPVGGNTAGSTEFLDGHVADSLDYFYRVAVIYSAIGVDGIEIESLTESGSSGPVGSSAQWFDWRRINVFVGVIVLCGFILFYISQAKKGKKLFIRKIAGLEAVDEAVGRATEMGKKIYFIPGTQDMDNVQTIAGVTILGRVAEVAATYDTYLEVPVSRSLVLVTAKEIVKEAYSKVGRPDAYNEDQVHYLTDDQFGYAAGIDGMVVREKPATIFFMGAFYAESLILAETGNSIGAIQIAGTAMPSQLPFFIASCDFTLIGEELFAASAYLAKEPKLLGSLKGQDVGKAIILVAIVLGVLLETFNIWSVSTLFGVID